jgi:hypothetical protein
MFRVVGWIAGALVVFAIISNPTQAAATTSNLLSGVVNVGQQTTAYLTSITVPTATGTPPSGSTSAPSGSTAPMCPEGTSPKRVILMDGTQGVACAFP